MHFVSTDFINLVSVYILVLIAPGLDFAVVLRESLLYGRRHGLVTVLGIMTAVIIHCTYTVLGLGIIIAKSLILFNVIKGAGIAYLLYIGVRALVSKGGGTGNMENTEDKKVGRSYKKAYLTGLTCNLLNPKCILFFLSIFSTLIAPDTPLEIKSFYALTMVLICGLWFSFVAFFLTIPSVTKVYRRLGMWIDKLTGAVFIILAISLIFQKGQA